MKTTELRWGLVLLCKQRQKYGRGYNRGREDKNQRYTLREMKRGTDHTQGSDVEGTVSEMDG